MNDFNILVRLELISIHIFCQFRFIYIYSFILKYIYLHIRNKFPYNQFKKSNYLYIKSILIIEKDYEPIKRWRVFYYKFKENIIDQYLILIISYKNLRLFNQKIPK